MKKLVKKGILIFLSFTMLMLFILEAIDPVTVHAGGIKPKDINLLYGQFDGGWLNTSSRSGEDGHKLYFGRYNLCKFHFAC